ncbi:MAG: Trans-aconitate 2-methyltransferase, partial [Acidobacteria bacterium]|nr:Trans-aconitate 2-methyltransferase [Acidobacteriota bacterium]
FAAERKQPFTDLVSLVEPREGMDILDLGCGTGEWTRELHDHLDAASTLGIDSSEAMLGKAGAFANARVRFERAEVESFAPDRKFDLVFSNAVLHWVADHEQLFARIAGFIAPGGQLAVQMPANEDNPSHVVAAVVAEESGVAPRVSDVLPVEQYARILHRLGFNRQHVRMQIYGHLLPSSADVVEWVKGSLLTDYERRMDAERFPDFLSRYTERLLAAIGDVRPFFYTYKRVLLWGSY